MAMEDTLAVWCTLAMLQAIWALCDLSTSEDKMEFDRWFDAASAVMLACCERKPTR